ncbi:hypothetical protein H7F33_05580 [Pedobacter sp. PAMC26386]|nr:hypothetical protein H7F33_05580 [Pedobacter sp. PAMC26386]
MKAIKFTPSTKKQNAMIGYLIGRMRIDEETKEELIYTYSEGRTLRISELYINEAVQVIKMLTGGMNMPETPANKMRRKILSMAHELRWEQPNGKINIERVNNWCIQYGYGNKALDQYSTSELPHLVTQFENMYRKHLNEI